jgi:tetratricopeptide (TPR) repeat protein
MNRIRSSRWLSAVGIALLALAGCRSDYTADHQRILAEKYYGGDVKGAAEYASGISDAERSETDHHALLWHLEAGNANLDAGNYEESMRCLERAEKLLYLFDGSTPRFHRPGLLTYRGWRSDRLMLHILKGFNYLADGQLEDFLVEIRRLRAEQFRYVLDEADPELRRYEASNSGRAGVPPLAMRDIFKDGDRNRIFQSSKLNDEYTEYSQRRRPRLPLLYNPLGFYFSALGYAIDNEYEEAVIDFRYLLMLDPENRLYREDCAALIRALGDKLPDGLENVGISAVPADQTVCFVVARGRPDAWKSRKLTYILPGKVPTDWSFSYPDYHRAADPGFSVHSNGATLAAGSHLVDLSEVLNEEYWQYIFPGMVDSAYRATVAMTVAHEAAKASLATALAMPNNDWKPLAVSSARLAVAATSRAFVSQLEWRRWVTLPRSYAVAHVQLPPPGTPRRMTLTVNIPGGGTRDFELEFSPEANRAVVYLRDVGNGNFLLKKWESME